MSVAAPFCFCFRESSFLPCKKAPNKGRVDHRIWLLDDEIVKRAEWFVRCERNGYTFHDKLFRPASIRGDATAVHRARLICSAVLQPDIRKGRAPWVKHPKVLEPVRDKPGYFYELVVVVPGLAFRSQTVTRIGSSQRRVAEKQISKQPMTRIAQGDRITGIL